MEEEVSEGMAEAAAQFDKFALYNGLNCSNPYRGAGEAACDGEPVRRNTYSEGDDGVYKYAGSAYERPKQYAMSARNSWPAGNQLTGYKTAPAAGDDGWESKYAKAQLEMATEAARWGQRFLGLESVYKDRMTRMEQAHAAEMAALRDECDKTLNRGYEEAYGVIKQLQEELKAAKG